MQLASCAGTFSRDGLDDGTKLLVETFLNKTNDQAQAWLDLGCGWGAVACFLQSARPDCRVLACDINRRAALLTQRNAQTNSLVVDTWCGDGASALRDGCCDAVLCNPPVRAGNVVIAKLFDDSARVLKKDGELWVVLRTAQGAKSWRNKLEAQFGNCDQRAQSGGFRILQCTR